MYGCNMLLARGSQQLAARSAMHTPAVSPAASGSACAHRCKQSPGDAAPRVLCLTKYQQSHRSPTAAQSLTGSGVQAPTTGGLLGTISCNLDINSEVCRELEEAAEEDEDIADILQGAKGDPVIIQQRVSLQLLTLSGCAASAHVLRIMIYAFTDQGKHGRQTHQAD